MQAVLLMTVRRGSSQMINSNYSIRDLDDNLQKMVAIENLVREAREELTRLKGTHATSGGGAIPTSVWAKVRQALAYYKEVNAFLASLKS
jgi:hypothetical protein